MDRRHITPTVVIQNVTDNANADLQAENDPNDAFTDILGRDPTKEQSQGPDLLEDLASRWTNYVQEGLDNETKTQLADKWHIPKNCPALDTPQLNEEIQALIPNSTIRRDGFLRALQSLLGKGLSALGTHITKILKDKENNKDLEITELVDAGKFFAEAHHRISIDRRYAINPFFNETGKKVATSAKISAKLYGDDFGAQWKSAQSASSIAKDLKAGTSLNYKRQPVKTRIKNRAGTPTRSYRKPANQVYKNFKHKKYNNKARDYRTEEKTDRRKYTHKMR